MSLWWLSVPALATLVGLGAAWSRRKPGAPAGPGLDVLLAVGSGGLFTALTFTSLWRFHLVGSNLSSSDFIEYCETLGRMRTGSPEVWSASRPWPSYALPGSLARSIGVIDALIAGALVSAVVFGAGLYLWGLAAHSRAAGIASVAIAATLGPLVLLARTPSFYPEVTAWFVLTSALVMLVFRKRGLIPYTLAVAAVGVALLMDLRGLAWGVSCGVALLIAALREGGTAGGVRFIVLLLGLTLSYRAGGAAYGPPSISLEDRGDVHRLLIESGRAPQEAPRPPPVDRGYQWGRTPLSQVPATLQTLAENAAAAPSGGFVSLRFLAMQRYLLLTLVIWLSIGGGTFAVFGMRRSPWLVIGALLTLAPFAACAFAAFRMVTWHPRFLLLGLPGVALVMGAGLGTLLHGRADKLAPRGRWGYAHVALSALVAWAVPLGWLDSPLSIASPWQLPFAGDDEPAEQWRMAIAGQEGADRQRECLAALKEDADAGRVISLE